MTLVLTHAPWFGDLESAYHPAGQVIRSSSKPLYVEPCIDGFVNVPIVALLFVPIADLDPTVAAAVFTLVGLLATAVSGWLTMRLLRPTAAQRWLIASAFALNGPLWYSIREGNTTHMILALLLVSALLLERGSVWLAGGILGAAAVIKAPLALFGVYFVARRRWREATGMLSVALGIGALSWMMFGSALHAQWFDRCVVQTAGQVIAGFNVQSVDGVLARAYGANPFSWDPVRMGGSFPIVRLLLIGLIAGIVAASLVTREAPVDRRAWAQEACAMLVLSLLVFPVSWTHYYLFLLVPISMLGTGYLRGPSRSQSNAVATIAVVLVSLPLIEPPFADSPVSAPLDRALSSAHFFGALGMLAVILKAQAKTSLAGSRSAPGSRPVE